MTQSILVVDDDPDTLTLIGLTLQRRGFEVIKAQSGAQALNVLSHDTPDLIILDVMMPQMDGYEVCREIKADPRIAHLPVVMLTAKAQTTSQLEGFRAGAVDYITKPVHPQDLVKRIQSVLEKNAPAAGQHGAHLVSVTAAKGGVGATTLAVNLALAMAPSISTILIDFDPGGTAAMQLGLEASHHLNELLADEGRAVEASAIEAALQTHASGLRILAAPDSAINATQATVILNLALGLCEICVFDLGWGLSAVARAVAPRSHDVILAIDSDRSTLLQASRLMNTLIEAGTSGEALKLVWINRQGAPTDMVQAAIRATLGRDPDAVIAPAPEAMFVAMENNRPLVIDRPEDPVALEIKQLARSLLQTS